MGFCQIKEERYEAKEYLKVGFLITDTSQSVRTKLQFSDQTKLPEILQLYIRFSEELQHQVRLV